MNPICVDIREATSQPLYERDESGSVYIHESGKNESDSTKGGLRRKLADRIGVKQATVAKWETDRALFIAEQPERKLAKVFGIKEESFT